MVRNAQGEYGNHRAVEERDNARLAVDAVRHQPVPGRNPEEPHHACGHHLAANIGLAKRGQRSTHVGPTHHRGIEQREQCLDIAPGASRDEGVHHAALLCRVDREPR